MLNHTQRHNGHFQKVN